MVSEAIAICLLLSYLTKCSMCHNSSRLICQVQKEILRRCFSRAAIAFLENAIFPLFLQRPSLGIPVNMICRGEESYGSNSLLPFLKHGDVVVMFQPHVDHGAFVWFKTPPHSDIDVIGVGYHRLAPWHPRSSQRVKLTDAIVIFSCDEMSIPKATLHALEFGQLSVPPDWHVVQAGLSNDEVQLKDGEERSNDEPNIPFDGGHAWQPFRRRGNHGSISCGCQMSILYLLARGGVERMRLRCVCSIISLTSSLFPLSPSKRRCVYDNAPIMRSVN